MANDAKLEQLKIAQEQAYQNKQKAYQAQQESWERLSKAKDKMNKLHDVKQVAFNDQEQAWRAYQSIQTRNGPRIEWLNSAQEIAFQNMKNAFDRASAAHNNRDGASAKSHTDDGHRYQAEAKGYVEERRRLVEECRNAKLRHEPHKTTFESAKIDFGRAKDEYENSKIFHQFESVGFKLAKEKFDAATKAFQARLDELKAENANKIKNKRAIAAKAGVPYQYRDDVYISEEPDGTVNIFFGGFGTPDGPGHGHYSMNSSGKVIYRRDPSENHGSKNFTGENGIFNGQPAKIVISDIQNSNRIDIYYGGIGEPDGIGHSHVSVIKESVRFWRENGKIIVDERTGIQ